jgi:hypothetical protein
MRRQTLQSINVIASEAKQSSFLETRRAKQQGEIRPCVKKGGGLR